MSTLIFQSFRTENVPSYIPQCLQSVRAWAQGAGHTYEFWDDAFLRLVPEWYRARAGWHTCVVADLARLLQARTYLQQGWERVVWMDADVLVFDPERLHLPPTRAFRYCREIWLHRTPEGQIFPAHKVNNAVCIFGPEALDHLNEYIARCMALVAALPAVSNSLMVGTDVLTSPFSGQDRIENVGIVSPMLLQAILRDENEVLRHYVSWHGCPVYAANLCNVYRLLYEAPGLFDYLLEQAIAKLLATRGGLLGEDRLRSL